MFGVLLESTFVKSNGLENPNQLEEILQYCFRDQALLTQAMTHRSWAHEQVSPRSQRDARNLHNEALEFLGDPTGLEQILTKLERVRVGIPVTEWLDLSCGR